MQLSGFDLALHSVNKCFLSTYYVASTLAFILSERQEPLQNSEERNYMI